LEKKLLIESTINGNNKTGSESELAKGEQPAKCFKIGGTN